MRLTFDLEGNGLYDTITQVHCIVCIDMEEGHLYQFHDHPELCNASGSLADGLAFMGQAEELIAHNQLCYDLPSLYKVFGWVPSSNTKITDTLVMSKSLNPDREMVRGCKSGPHSIEAWGIRLGVAKPQHEEWEVFTPEMLHRCTEDTRINVLVYEELKKEEKGWDYSFIYALESRVAQECFYAEQHGWPFDKAGAEGHVLNLEQEMGLIEAEVLPMIPLIPKAKEGNITPAGLLKKGQAAKEAGLLRQLFFHPKEGMTVNLQEKNWVDRPFTSAGKLSKQTKDHFGEAEGDAFVWGPYSRVDWTVINLGSDKQVKEYLLRIGWKPTEWNRNKKTHAVTSPKLTEDSLDSLSNPVGKMIAKWIKMQHRKSQLKGWIEACRPDGRVPSVMNTLACPTVRMSHKVVANVPSVEKGAFYAKEMRSVFTAEPGYVLVGTDAASCQLRMLCHYMNDQDYTSAVLYGDKDKGTDIHSVNMRAAGLPTRGHAKNFIYGFLFGAGATKVGKLINGDARAGQVIMDTFLRKLPKLKALRDGLMATWKRDGYLMAIDGRRLYVRKQHELLCYLLQSAEAIVMKMVICYIMDWVRGEGLDARLLNVYHDELTFMVKEEHAERLCYLKKEAFRLAGEAFNLNVPVEGGPAVGKNWGDIH